MAVNVAIIGLGQIGASLGLAMAAHTDKVRRIGNDIAPEVVQQAKKMGAVDAVQYNLPSLAAEADVVILALPFDQIRETLKIMALDLRENVVIMDTSPVKAPVAALVKELLPGNRHYVGLAPSISAPHLDDMARGIDAARADLFQKSVIGVAAPAGTPEAAVTLAASLVQIAGGTPLFADIAEIDGLMTAVHILPQLVSASLLNAVMDQPGWQEGRKLAGKPLAALGQAFSDAPESLAETALLNRENTVRLLDGMIASLQGLRDTIQGGETDRVSFRTETASKNLNTWRSQRRTADWTVADQDPVDMGHMGSMGGVFQRLFGLNALTDKKKKK